MSTDLSTVFNIFWGKLALMKGICLTQSLIVIKSPKNKDKNYVNEKPAVKLVFHYWCGQGESDPHLRLGKSVFYH